MPPHDHRDEVQSGPGTSAELLPEVYDELRKLARARLARERQWHQTLQPTALVHEAYMRVAGDGDARRWHRRGHIFAAAALAMRRILVDGLDVEFTRDGALPEGEGEGGREFEPFVAAAADIGHGITVVGAGG